MKKLILRLALLVPALALVLCSVTVDVNRSIAQPMGPTPGGGFIPPTRIGGGGGGGDITGVTAGTGLTGGATSGNATLNVGCSTGISCGADALTMNLATQDCAAGQFFDSNTATGAFTCVAEVGDISSVVAGAGLTNGATSGAATVDVGAGTGITVNTDDVAIDPTYTQRRVSGSCSAPDAIRAVAQDGTVTCTSGTGDITAVNVTAPISGGGASGSVTVGLTACGNDDELWRWDADTVAWVCSADVISVSFPDGGGMTNSGGAAQQGANVSVALRDDCDEGQLLEWTDLDGEGGGTDFGWECADDDTGGGGGVGGSGTTNTIPRWTAATTLGDSIITQSGSTITVTGSQVGTSAGVADGITWTNTASAATNNVNGGTFSAAGTLNATAAERAAYGVIAQSVATRSAGANSVYNHGLYTTASGGQVNRAIYADSGDVVLNATSGSTTINGATAIGNASGDAHSLTGTLAVNGAAGITSQVLKINGSSLPSWGADEGAIVPQSFSTTGTVDDFALGATTTTLFFTGGSGVTLGGLQGGTDGRCVDLVNSASGSFLTAIAHEAGGSTAGNRIRVVGATTWNGPQYSSHRLCYEGADSRWHLLVTNRMSSLTVDTTATVNGTAFTVPSGNTTLRNLIVSGASGADSISTTFAATAQTTSRAAALATNTGTFNTTSGALSSYGGSFSSTATRSSGANNLTNYGIYADASGGQVNYAGYFGAGEVYVKNAVSFEAAVNATSAAPTISGCGTGPTRSPGGQFAGYVIAGTMASGCTITFPATFTNRPSCVVTAGNGDANVLAYTVSATAITITGGITDSTVIDYSCVKVGAAS
jgi:hypothetical protein